jgi:hypothetical protein
MQLPELKFRPSNSQSQTPKPEPRLPASIGAPILAKNLTRRGEAACSETVYVNAYTWERKQPYVWGRKPSERPDASQV